MAIRCVGDEAQTVLQHMVATGGTVVREWRVVGMDGPIGRRSDAYTDPELARRIQAARGGRVETRLVLAWTDDGVPADPVPVSVPGDHTQHRPTVNVVEDL